MFVPNVPKHKISQKSINIADVNSSTYKYNSSDNSKINNHNNNINDNNDDASNDDKDKNERRSVTYSDVDRIDKNDSIISSRSHGGESKSQFDQLVRGRDNSGYPDELYRMTMRPMHTQTNGMPTTAAPTTASTTTATATISTTTTSRSIDNNDKQRYADADHAAHEHTLQLKWAKRFEEKRNRIRLHRRQIRLQQSQTSFYPSTRKHLSSNRPRTRLPSHNRNHINHSNINNNSKQLSNLGAVLRDHQLPNANEASPNQLLIGRNRRESRFEFSRSISRHQSSFPLQRPRSRRFCSARDPATLAFEAPTVFEGKLRSMSSDRRRNFSVTFEVKQIYKRQLGFKLPSLIRLQFSHRNISECDIYREKFRARGYIRNELEPGKIYILFVNQIDTGNFTIIGQPIKRTKKAVNDVVNGVSAKYGEFYSRDISIQTFIENFS